MTEILPVEHHRSIEYRVYPYPLQAEGFTVTPSADASRIEVAGVCPGCGGRTATTWDFGSATGYKGLRRVSPTPSNRPTGARTVCCDCGYAHLNRPDDAVFLGCGAHWQVELP